MALTKEAVSRLGAKVIGHDDIKATVQLPTGLVKTSRGLLARPSTTVADTRSGKLCIEDSEDTTEDTKQGDVPIPPPPEDAVEDAKPELVTRPSRRKKQQPAVVRVEVSIEGHGVVPSQYTHCYIGEGIIVLGCNEYSYLPPMYHISDTGDVAGVLELDKSPGRKYVYMGNTYKDSNNIKNVLLVELKG